MSIGLLVPLILGAFAVHSSDDDTDEGPGPEEIGEELNYDGSDLLEGTAGDDTLSAGQDDSLAPGTIDLLGGGDTAIVELSDSTTVFGGDGDDSITATGVLNVLEGGAGNDTLTADDSNRILGGEGHDVLNFTHGSCDQGERGVANGGDGDDVIHLQANALINAEDLNNVGGVGVVGGGGADEFNIIYDFYELDENITPADDTISRGFVSISDFVPNEDALVLEVERNAETADRDVLVELDQTQEDGTYTSLLTLTVEETDEEAEAVNILTVISAAPFTLDDVQLVGVQAN